MRNVDLECTRTHHFEQKMHLGGGHAPDPPRFLRVIFKGGNEIRNFDLKCTRMHYFEKKCYFLGGGGMPPDPPRFLRSAQKKVHLRYGNPPT